LAEFELETQKTSFFETINPEKMVNQVTAQKIHQKTARVPSILLVRRFTFRTVNHCLTAGYLTSQSVRVFRAFRSCIATREKTKPQLDLTVPSPLHRPA
jgi:hypothetical protein